MPEMVCDDILEWPGFGLPADFRRAPGWISRCRLRVLDMLPGQPDGVAPSPRWIVVVSDIGAQSGTSITNAAENLIRIVCKKFQIDRSRLLWIEHYPHGGSYRERMDVVSLEGKRPRWRVIREEELDLIRPYLPEVENVRKNLSMMLSVRPKRTTGRVVGQEGAGAS